MDQDRPPDDRDEAGNAPCDRWRFAPLLVLLFLAAGIASLIG